LFYGCLTTLSVAQTTQRQNDASRKYIHLHLVAWLGTDELERR